MDTSNNTPIRAGGKESLRSKEINRKNREFWEARSEKFKKQIERWPDFVEIARNKIEADIMLNGIKSAHSMEDEVRKLVEELGPAPKLKPREQKIWDVIQRGFEGEPYCRELRNVGVKPCKSWITHDFPPSYLEAYREGEPWRKRIQDEKYRIRRKAELIQLVEK